MPGTSDLTTNLAEDSLVYARYSAGAGVLGPAFPPWNDVSTHDLPGYPEELVASGMKVVPFTVHPDYGGGAVVQDASVTRMIEPPNSVILLVGREEFSPPTTFAGGIAAASHDCVAIGVRSVDDGPTAVDLVPEAWLVPRDRVGEQRHGAERGDDRGPRQEPRSTVTFREKGSRRVCSLTGGAG